MNTPFTVTVNGSYETYEIPPRCRNPRMVEHATISTTEIPVIGAQEAPVAFRVHESFPEPAVQEIRTYEGRLYYPYSPGCRQDEPSDPVSPGSSQFPARLIAGHPEGRSPDEHQELLRQRYAGYLLVGDEVWVEATEPRYVVMTFGLGSNHGGTDLFTAHCDNGNVRSDSYFRADEFDAAIAHAIATADGRGDTESVARFQRDPEALRAIEVLAPKAVSLVTIPPTPREVAALQCEYFTARHAMGHVATADEESEAFDELLRLRQEIIARGHVPVESEEARPYEARAVAQVA